MTALFATRRPLVGLALLLALFGGMTVAGAFTVDSETESSPKPPPPANTEDAALLIRCGLGAEALCAAGVQIPEILALVAAVQNEVVSSGTTLQSFDQTYAQARTSYDQLRRKVRAGLGTGAENAAFSQAKTTFENAEAARDAYKDNLRTVALTAVSPTAAQTVATIYQNRSWGLATQCIGLAARLRGRSGLGRSPDRRSAWATTAWRESAHRPLPTRG